MILKKGDKGIFVKKLQRFLGITDDGNYGNNTRECVRRKQRELGIKDDGIVGNEFCSAASFSLITQNTKNMSELSLIKTSVLLAASTLCPADGFVSIGTALNKYLPLFNMNNEHLAHFLAQVGHESNLLPVAENLNYSVPALKRINKSKFAKWAHNPKMLGANMYANRMGNGAPHTLDGWYYRGRGLIQITGRDNYETIQTMAERRGFSMNIVDYPDSVLDGDNPVLTALIWWDMNGINKLISNGADVRRVTRVVNGGYNGLKDRQRRYDAVCNML